MIFLLKDLRASLRFLREEDIFHIRHHSFVLESFVNCFIFIRRRCVPNSVKRYCSDQKGFLFQFILMFVLCSYPSQQRHPLLARFSKSKAIANLIVVDNI